ncbi:endonuclease/exonuclease/phosphatase family protein [Bailinhaonella thermotolerans]|uniref:Endonuclease/exonuclease/phosphatase domain-containing protein n=1 Tax=Bailinhaonella thermotolerans TaxID=1070861 RepID=A0A3A4ARN3_9ACTN|nr:endonuclease/exonuclease/phosphatase family protein [Bailinhaonella thermotolerans]RJL31269.1 hypothetical protein D5H75_19605 [Bailinhaonella thermotolerans]
MHRGPLIGVVAGLLTLVLVGHGMLPALNGVTTVIESFLPWLGLLVPVLLAAAIHARSGAALAIVAVSALVWGVMFVPDMLRGERGGPYDVRVATVNVGAGNKDPRATVRAVAQDKPDILAVQEITAASREPVHKVLEKRFPHHYSVGTVGLWSRWPLRQTQRVDLGLSWTRAVRAEVATPKGPVTVYSVHLASARPGETADRDKTLTAAARHVKADKSARLILAGDLNTATTDRRRADLVPPLKDAQEESGTGLGFTWPAAFPMTRPDHILYRGLAPVSAKVIKAPNTDHRAPIADLRLT